MALSTHPGGAADKAGFIHEALWGVRGFIFVLNGEAAVIRIETPGEDGAEFYLDRPGGRENWQAKRQITGQETWSFQRLTKENVLPFFFEKFRAGEQSVFASVSDAPELRMLTENAAAAGSFDEFRDKFLDKKRRKQFNDLRGHVKAASDEETFAFLRSVSVHGGREITLESLLGCALGAMFQGPWQTTMALLRDLYLRGSHETLTASDIEQYLRNLGIERRRAGAPDSGGRIKNLTSNYVAGQRSKLIRGTPIRRSVADDIVKKILTSKASLDFLITGAAGGGKSGCTLQIVEDLQAAGVAVLAFRLDRVEPVGSSILLGEKLGLGESPALVLADSFPGQPVVLVIDQLDFVSTTSGRHPDFFDTIAALRDEVAGLRQARCIHLVLACRKFDYDHDHRLKRLAAKDQPLIELREFAMDEVGGVVRDEGGDIARLTPRQQAMLRLPQNLSLFVEARLAKTENRFTTSKDLCDAYWTEKRKSVAAQRADFGDRWLPAIKRMAATMSERQELSIPARDMDDFPPEFLDKMASEGVLSWDGKRYGFGHETFFDYCFARTLPNDGRDFVPFLEKDQQRLFRRAQLRQVLAFLRDDNFPAYLETVTYILRSDLLRPHLKILTVELLAAHPEARDEELKLLMPWIETEFTARREDRPNPDKLASRIWDLVFASRTLFPVVDRVGLLDQWLRSDETWLQHSTTRYLRWQSDQHGDRVAQLLEPFVGQPEWRDRLRHVMEGHALRTSRRLFDLFLRLLKDGTLSEDRDRVAFNGRFWSMLHSLAKERPEWCAEVAAQWFDGQLELAATGDQETGATRRISGGSSGIDDLFTSARAKPRVFLEHVLSAVLRGATAFKYENDEGEFPRDRLWLIRFWGGHPGLLESYLESCVIALETLGQSKPGELRPFVDQLLPVRLYTANVLLMSAYLSGPMTFADEALNSLADEPARLVCGYSENAYWTARQVIKACSPHCSDQTFEKLERVLLAYVPEFERTGDGLRHRGHAAYNFVAALADNRLSRSAKTQLAEWTEKFKKPDAPPRGVRSYTVGSPIGEEPAQHMTDEQWLGAIAKYDSEERRYSFEHPERGGALELARMLEKFTKEQPLRFAELAAGFPEKTHPYYFSHVLRALKEAEISFALKAAVARRVYSFDHHDCIVSALDLLGAAKANELPEDAVAFIETAASHPNPDAELRDEEQTGFGDDIATQGINSIRGRAAEAIRDLVWADEQYLTIFKNTIQKLVNDGSLAVRFCVASTLCAVLWRDPNLGLQWTKQLLEAEDRLLATPYPQELLRRALPQNLDVVGPIIERMLNSESGDVRQAGATLACLARLYHETADPLAEAALKGDEHCRLGACEVANCNLLYPETRPWCEAVLPRLFVDESSEVRCKAAGCFWFLWQSPETPLTSFGNLIRTFLTSPAFADEPSSLLHALEQFKCRLSYNDNERRSWNSGKVGSFPERVAGDRGGLGRSEQRKRGGGL